ncbi:hypothetical protein K7X08_005523 [Anisodus acutangulus]|uniref:Seipin n=1 Tax=Anisodus acutangulus TaxID=402998 RepID=A0A9Q1LTJ9_9SOLA|nr:hypothetical protein K7X08_005523 [Anisodus acutangulus]
MDEQAIIGENVVGNFLEVTCQDYKKSPNFVTNLMQYSLLLGAEKILMGRKSQEAFSCSSLSSWTDEVTAREKRRNKGKSVLQDEKLACGTSRDSAIESIGLLVMGFVISGLTMRRLLEEPIETTKALNFDYTKTSPVAFAPLAASGLSTTLISKPKIEDRPIPYNHKLQLTVSLTMPESEYNRKLGIFQVRVDCLSSNGKVTATSSYPTMLKFKSQPIRLVETAIKSIPLVTGFQSEVQNLKLIINDFIEGFEPTACFKVVLEKRAEYQPEGAGIPEIYAATLHVETELPQIKRIIWIWRRSVFVWIGILVFLSQISFALIFCRPVLLPGRRIMTVLGTKKNAQKNKISW